MITTTELNVATIFFWLILSLIKFLLPFLLMYWVAAKAAYFIPK